MKAPSFYGKRRIAGAVKYVLCFLPPGLYLLLRRDGIDYAAAVLLLVSALAACCILFFLSRRESKLLRSLQRIAEAAESGDTAELSTLEDGAQGAVQHACVSS